MPWLEGRITAAKEIALGEHGCRKILDFECCDSDKQPAVFPVSRNTDRRAGNPAAAPAPVLVNVEKRTRRESQSK